MSNENFESWLGNGIAAVFTAIQTDAIFQYVSLALTIVSVVISIAFTLWKWWKAAKADGRIDEKEIEEGLKIIKDGAEELKGAVEKEEKNGEDKH